MMLIVIVFMGSGDIAIAKNTCCDEQQVDDYGDDGQNDCCASDTGVRWSGFIHGLPVAIQCATSP